MKKKQGILYAYIKGGKQQKRKIDPLFLPFLDKLNRGTGIQYASRKSDKYSSLLRNGEKKKLDHANKCFQIVMEKITL